MKMEPEQNITPDRWVILEYDTDEGIIHKILSSWKGGYVNGDSWRISSAIMNTTEMKHYNEYTTKSGSTYKCLHANEGLSEVTRDLLSRIRKDFPETKVKMLCYGDPT